MRPPWLDGYVADPRHGPLPAALLLLSVATGLVDAVSILSLGRVFVANMTGNIVFIGFALARAPGFSLVASVIALAGFLVGAAIGGAAITRFGSHRGRLLRNVAAAEVVLLAMAGAVVAVAGAPFGDGVRDVTVALAAIAFGLQNAAARKLAVPDVTTTVLTMTLTGVAADLRGRNRPVAVRRLIAVVAMLLGAFGGAELVLHVAAAAGLFTAAGVVAVVVVITTLASRTPAPWQADAR